jgi:hypothetical protein
MSLFHPVNLVCPACKTLITMDAVGSVNADRRPDLRQSILDNRFQDVTCGACGTSFRLQPEFNYLDVGRGQWIAAMPAPHMPRHLDIEDEVTALFATSYGDRAPKAARDVGEALSVRLTFGWPALREKLILREHGLDDRVIEVMKVDLMRRLPSAPFRSGTELRLLRVAGEHLPFVWVDSATEQPGQQVVLPRAAHDGIAGNLAPWQGVIDRLTDGPFVDMQKLYMGPGRGAAPPPEPDAGTLAAE